jgi:uncharacterized membrane protein (DUF485 family)
MGYRMLRELVKVTDRFWWRLLSIIIGKYECAIILFSNLRDWLCIKIYHSVDIKTD